MTNYNDQEACNVDPGSNSTIVQRSRRSSKRICPTRRGFIALAGLGAVSLLSSGIMTGCGSSSSSGNASSSPQRLVCLMNGATTGFDPAVGWDGWYLSRVGMFETLTGFDQELNVIPRLAKHWESIDEVTWKFTMQEGVVFHSGNALDAQAVKNSLERTLAANTRLAHQLEVESIQAEGNELIIKTAHPLATLPGDLADPCYSIVDTAAHLTSSAQMGTGPFMAGDVMNPEHFILKRFENYWRGTPQLAEVECSTANEPAARSMALQSGEADAVWSLQASDLEQAKSSSRFKVLETESARSVFGFMNTAYGPCSDKTVRQALSYALDRDVICSQLLKNTVKANATPYPSYLSYSAPAAQWGYSHDEKKAAELFSQAGYTRTESGKLTHAGEVLTLRVAYYEMRPEIPVIAQALQDQFGAMGIDVVLNKYEKIDGIFKTDTFDILLYNATTISNGDPSYFLNFYYTQDGPSNAGQYRNDRVDAIITQMRSSFDKEERNKLTVEAQKIILDDAPNLFIGSAVMNIVTQANVSGIQLYPVEFYGVTYETTRMA